jgi:6-pyruvoyltetrahydropterin/6-carboxytetrahydropterin synthase
MFRLTREVRFAVNRDPHEQWDQAPTNSYAGYPSLTGVGTYLVLRVTLRGQLHPKSQYLINIKRIDEAARSLVREELWVLRQKGPAEFLWSMFGLFEDLWRDRFESVSLALSPFLQLEATHREILVTPMMRLSQKFEFSASHRLHNPALSDEENRRTFGKCNNALGHGHNYELQVTLRGTPDSSGLIIDVPAFERVVAETVIDRFDHKNLNAEVAEFKDVIPSVENIAMVIFRLLKPRFAKERATLASVTVWETPKTWCEYSE